MMYTVCIRFNVEEMDFQQQISVVMEQKMKKVLWKLAYFQ
jgi:hypothetical protein